jgi:hypothetical protein
VQQYLNTIPEKRQIDRRVYFFTVLEGINNNADNIVIVQYTPHSGRLPSKENGVGEYARDGRNLEATNYLR